MRGLMLAFAMLGVCLVVPLLFGPSSAKAQFIGAAQAQSAQLKVCRATNNGGRQISWGCVADQPCCFDPARNLAYCGPTGGRC
jgi:hypothetical protein